MTNFCKKKKTQQETSSESGNNDKDRLTEIQWKSQSLGVQFCETGRCVGLCKHHQGPGDVSAVSLKVPSNPL